jgi:predicted DNA-binding transcriptional regulator YafY
MARVKETVRKPMEQKVRTNRILAIDTLIRDGKYPNASTMARRPEITARTVQRAIEYDLERQGYYYSEANFYIKSVPPTEGELFSIALFDPLLEQHQNTPLEGDLRKIFGKIVQSLPDNVDVEANFLTGQVSFIPDIAAKIDWEVFKVIFTALKTKSTMTFEYRPLSKDTYMRRRRCEGYMNNCIQINKVLWEYHCYLVLIQPVGYQGIFDL